MRQAGGRAPKIPTFLIASERAATAIEYALLMAGISAAIIAVVFSLGSQLDTTFTNVQTQISTYTAG